MDNIKIAKKDANDDEVIKAAKDAMCHDFIEKLPNGMVEQLKACLCHVLVCCWQETVCVLAGEGAQVAGEIRGSPLDYSGCLHEIVMSPVPRRRGRSRRGRRGNHRDQPSAGRDVKPNG